MQQIQYFGPDRETTLFIEKDARIWLRQLCGLTCGSDGNDAGPAYTRGPAIVQSARIALKMTSSPWSSAIFRPRLPESSGRLSAVS